jgi:hypothetical protein
MKVYIVGEEVYLHIFLTSALEGDENFTPRPLYPQETPQYLQNTRLSEIQGRSKRFGEERISCRYRDLKPGCSSLWHTHYTDCACAVPIFGPKREREREISGMINEENYTVRSFETL